MKTLSFWASGLHTVLALLHLPTASSQPPSLIGLPSSPQWTKHWSTLSSDHFPFLSTLTLRLVTLNTIHMLMIPDPIPSHLWDISNMSKSGLLTLPANPLLPQSYKWMVSLSCKWMKQTLESSLIDSIPFILCLNYHEILFDLPSEYIQNTTTSHHLHS